MQKQRRDFLKITTVGATGLLMGGASRAHAAWPSSGTLEINPDVSNMRVVGCNDTAMMKTTPATMSFAAENSAVDSARVQANMDAMAMQLAQKTTADEAWKAIFRSSKAWASTLVAIKVNVTEPKNMPRVAVVEKLCRVFAGLGVPASNIIVYDGGPSSFAQYTSNYTSYFSTTDTSKIPGVISNINDALGGTTNGKLPDGSTATCTADVANGKVDILVSVAVNKGHPNFGGATLCMKNHFGTFIPNHTDLNNYILKINKSDAIIGGAPPRQQLCVIDSLIANVASNTGTPEKMPGYLVMGTFAPAVDYLTVKKVREEVLSATHDAAVIDTYVTSFGYTAKDPVWVLVPPAGTTTDGGASGTGGTGSGGKSGPGGSAGSAGSTGSGGAGGSSSGGVQGTGGTKTGGTEGSGGTGGAGVKGSSGAGSGGVNASGGARTGGSTGTGGAGGGGTNGTAGTSGGGTSGMGGVGGSGGRSGATTNGGSPGSGGTSSSNSVWGGTGGATTSAAGGALGTGGTSATNGPGASAGCGCALGESPRGGGRLGWMLASGALVAGMLQRLAVRKDIRAQNSESPEKAGAAKADLAKDGSHEPPA